MIDRLYCVSFSETTRWWNMFCGIRIPYMFLKRYRFLLALTRPHHVAPLPRIAYDRLIADFEALECLRNRQQERKAKRTGKNPQSTTPEPRRAEQAAQKYLAATPADEQTRASVRPGDHHTLA